MNRKVLASVFLALIACLATLQGAIAETVGPTLEYKGPQTFHRRVLPCCNGGSFHFLDLWLPNDRSDKSSIVATSEEIPEGTDLNEFLADSKIPSLPINAVDEVFDSLQPEGCYPNLAWENGPEERARASARNRSRFTVFRHLVCVANELLNVSSCRGVIEACLRIR